MNDTYVGLDEFEEMAQSDDIRKRARGVMATAFHNAGAPEPLDSANRLIRDMTEAGLWVVIGEDLRGHIDHIVGLRLEASQ